MLLLLSKIKTKPLKIRSLGVLYSIIVFSLLIFTAQVLYAADLLIPTKNIAKPESPKLFVIGIGINNYQSDFWHQLKWPAMDAKRISETIGQTTNYRVVKNLLINNFALKEEILSTLNQISHQARNQDVVVLYISGHGSLVQTDDGELERVVVTHDSQPESLKSTGILHSQLYDWLNNLEANKKLMIFATCHSGEGKSNLTVELRQLLGRTKGELISLSHVSEGTLVLAAAAQGEAARENDQLQGDIYTHFFIEAVHTYDRNKDGMVTALEAHDYARERTWTFTQGQQRPTASSKFIGDADVPLYGMKSITALPLLEAYDDSLKGFMVQVNDGVKGRLPSAFPLEPGRNVVTLYKPATSKPFAEYQVKTSKGEVIPLQKVMFDRPYQLEITHRRYQWSDSSWKWSDSTWNKLAGDNVSSRPNLKVGYQHGQFSMGLIFELPEEAEEPLRSSIVAKTRNETFGLFVGYQRRVGHFTNCLSIELVKENMSIELIDQSVSNKLKFRDESFSPSLLYKILYPLSSNFDLSLEVGARKGEWQFTPIGKLSGTRSWLGLGLRYRYSFKAKTL